VRSHHNVKREGGPGHRSPKGEGGFTLVEVLISTLVMTVGLVGIAGMLAATTTAQISARESARSVRLAQAQMDELMKLPFTNPAIAVGGNLDDNEDNYFVVLSADGSDSPDENVGTTLRWVVTDGPTDDTRAITVRVINNAQLARRTELSSIIREW
jgi:Tfp pilus assembly protein PilV